jgi:hypothetical protein
MSNKQIAWYSIVGYIVCALGYVIEASSLADLCIYGGGIVWIGFGIAGWVRLIKNN